MSADGRVLSSGAHRVLLVHSSSGRYGADRQLALIAGGLDRSRFEPLVVLPGPGELAEELERADVEVHIRPLGVIRRSFANPLGAARIAAATAADASALGSLISRRRISLVHSNTSVVLGGAAAAARAGVPHVWHVRELYSRFPRLWPLHRRLLQRADALACISQAAAAQFSASAPVRIVPDGLTGAIVRAPREQAREALGLPADAPVVAVVGRISELKGQHVLVRALADPRLAEREAIGLLAGDPWPGSEQALREVLELARSLGLGTRLRWVGFREDMANVYGAADVVAVPSVAAEGLGGVAIEAAAAGCVVIASDAGGLREVIVDGVTGRLVEPGDAAALASAATELLADPARREELGGAAAADVRERYAAHHVHAAVASLYEDLVAAGRRGP